MTPAGSGFAAFAAVISGVGPALAQQHFGPFIIDPDLPSVIVLNGQIDDRSALEFRRALEAAPDTQIIALNSPGGAP